MDPQRKLLSRQSMSTGDQYPIHARDRSTFSRVFLVNLRQDRPRSDSRSAERFQFQIPASSKIVGYQYEARTGEKISRADSGRVNAASKARAVVAGDVLDEECLYYEMVTYALGYRHRVNRVSADKISVKVPVPDSELQSYLGMDALHQVAMAVRAALQNRLSHWVTIHSPKTVTDVGHAASMPKAKKSFEPRGPYRTIDPILCSIAEGRPHRPEEVFKELDRRRVRFPNAKCFRLAGGWLKAYEHKDYSETAGAWLSTRWRKVGGFPFDRGPNPNK
jgi:hypothetical protein